MVQADRTALSSVNEARADVSGSRCCACEVGPRHSPCVHACRGYAPRAQLQLNGLRSVLGGRGPPSCVMCCHVMALPCRKPAPEVRATAGIREERQLGHCWAGTNGVGVPAAPTAASACSVLNVPDAVTPRCLKTKKLQARTGCSESD